MFKHIKKVLRKVKGLLKGKLKKRTKVTHGAYVGSKAEKVISNHIGKYEGYIRSQLEAARSDANRDPKLHKGKVYAHWLTNVPGGMSMQDVKLGFMLLAGEYDFKPGSMSEWRIELQHDPREL